MKTVTAIFTSDRVNKYGMVMPVGVIESGMDQSWNVPLPASVGHDFHRAIGWNAPVALHLEPRLASLFGIFQIAETDEEMKLVEKVLGNAVKRSLSRLDENQMKNLEHRLQSHLTSDHRRHAQGCGAVWDKGLATRVFPEIFSNRDNDGLVELKI